MKVEVEIDSEDGTVTVRIEEVEKDRWSYRDEYGRLEITIPPRTTTGPKA